MELPLGRRLHPACGSPDGQVPVETIAMPVSNVTTAAFGGPTLQTLYVSTAHHPGERLSGSLFKLETDVPGLPENQFRL